jgi:hypothetical protein
LRPLRAIGQFAPVLPNAPSRVRCPSGVPIAQQIARMDAVCVELVDGRFRWRTLRSGHTTLPLAPPNIRRLSLHFSSCHHAGCAGHKRKQQEQHPSSRTAWWSDGSREMSDPA